MFDIYRGLSSVNVSLRDIMSTSNDSYTPILTLIYSQSVQKSVSWSERHFDTTGYRHKIRRSSVSIGIGSVCRSRTSESDLSHRLIFGDVHAGI